MLTHVPAGLAASGNSLPDAARPAAATSSTGKIHFMQKILPSLENCFLSGISTS
jgi:hypothetical protein